MGFCVPSGIGAQLGRPDRLVVTITGDGSFQMNIQELATAAFYNIPVKIIILNNGYLGMVRQWQELFFEQPVFRDPSGGRQSRLRHGGQGLRSGGLPRDSARGAARHPGEGLRPSGTRGRGLPGGAKEENVFPMIPTGRDGQRHHRRLRWRC